MRQNIEIGFYPSFVFKMHEFVYFKNDAVVADIWKIDAESVELDAKIEKVTDELGIESPFGGAR